MQKRFVIILLTVLVIAIASTGILTLLTGNYYYTTGIEEILEKNMALMVANFHDMDKHSTEDVRSYGDDIAKLTDLRITVMDIKGRVIADTEKDPDSMENHNDRPEFIKAKNHVPAYEERYSNTLNAKLIYVAKYVNVNDFEGVIRLSTPLTKIKNFNEITIIMVLWIIIIAVVLSLMVAWIFNREFAKPIHDLTVSAMGIASGNYGEKVLTYHQDEFYDLNEAFNMMSDKLHLTVSELKDNNAKMRAILYSSVNGVLAIGNNHQVLLANNKSRELLGMDTKDPTGMVYEYLKDIELLELVRRGLEDDEYDDINIELGGYFLKISSSSIRLSKDSTEQMGVLLIVQDVTQLMKLEKVRTDFVSNVSHEIKTPLTSIRGFIETLRSGSVEDEATYERFLSIIDVESQRLYDLVQDLLVLSEIETRTEEVHREDVNMLMLFNEVYELLKYKAEQKQLKLHINLPAEAIIFNCNRDRMKQVLINLTENAIKYTEEGEVSMDLALRGNRIVMKVSDTGFGIPEEAIDRIFERFYRVDKGRSRKMGGTGLGLAIVKNIVKLYHGDILVDSEVDKGTTFTLEFDQMT